jgi:hypothetical protein
MSPSFGKLKLQQDVHKFCGSCGVFGLLDCLIVKNVSNLSPEVLGKKID